MEVSLEAEGAMLSDIRMDVSALDIYKAFDCIPRHILYPVLAAAGMPVPVLSAYARYHESARIFHSFEGVLGKEHKRAVSIPQGCPWSMCACALLLRPLIAMVHDAQAIP
eukprot:15158517-Alexandrium_andersonii.AAC.1